MRSGADSQTLTTPRLRALFAVLRRDGVDVEAALARGGLRESELLNPLHRLPRAVVLELFGALGLFGEVGTLALRVVDELQSADLDLFGHLLASAATLGEAMLQAEHYVALIHSGVQLRLRLQGQQAYWTHRIAGRTQLPTMTDFSVGMMVRWIRNVTVSQISLSEVRLARPRPKHESAYRAWFGVSIQFDAEVNTIVLPREALDLVLPGADRSLHAVLQRQAVALLEPATAASGASSFAERARSLMAGELSRAPDEMTAATLAARLRISERTLRRQLADAGATYSSLLDEVRRERALARILDLRLNVSALAAELGFSGPTTLGRAFRRWTGTSPTVYRMRLRGDQSSG